MRYNVLIAKSIQELVDKVEAALSEGWATTGGISVLSTSVGTTYIQSVILYEAAYDY